ncbi:hypothetical protein JCM9957A_69990 [Kineosporia succinea]
MRAPRRTAAVYGILAVIGVTGIVLLSLDGAWFAVVAAAVLTLFWVVVTVRALGNGVYTDGYQLINRNDLGRRRVPWVHVARFEYRGVRGLGLWDGEGEWTTLQYLPSGVTAERALAALDEELRRSRA